MNKLECKSNKLKYSICVCNYNMADTINAALTSVLDQIDDNYEVLVVDDGSTDNSVEIIKVLQKKYNNLRLLSLKRDNKRELEKQGILVLGRLKVNMFCFI